MKVKMTMGQRVKAFFGNVPVQNVIDWNSGDGSIDPDYTDKNSQLKANLGWVFAANQVIADECASVPIRLIKKMPDGDDEEVFTHPVLDLLNNPNAVLSSKQFWNLYFSYLNLTGEAYILKTDINGKPMSTTRELPTALFPLPANLCQFVLADNGRYDESHVLYGGVAYPIQCVLRDINPDPENYFNGMSIVRKSSLTIDTDLQMKRWNNKMFKNNGRLGSVVTFPNALSDEDFKRAKQMFNEQYVGTNNAFKNIILDNGASVSPFMMTTQDLDFLASKQFSRDEILAMFKVSTSNLGIVEDTNRASATTQEYGFRKRCVKPRLDQMADFLNMRLLRPIYGDEYYIDFGDVLPEDTERKLKEAQAGLNKWLSIDEVREMYDMEALPDGLGKEIYGQLNMVPLSDLRVINSEDMAEDDNQSNGDGGQSDESDADGGSPDDTPKTPTNEPEGGKNEELEAKELRIKMGRAKMEAYDKQRKRYVRQMSRASRKMFNEQKEDALKWVDENAKSFKDFAFTKDWAKDMVDWAFYRGEFAKTIQKILQLIIAEVGQEEYERLIELDEFDPYTKNIQKYVKEASKKNSKEVNDETEKQLRATLKEGISAGESVEEIKTRVSRVFGEASTRRAYLIAQTETALAQNYADVEAWKQTDGVVVAKEWYGFDDGATCGWCREMDGKILPLDENFFNKGDRFKYTDDKGHTHDMKLDYRSIDVPPLHPDCRCVLLPVMG